MHKFLQAKTISNGLLVLFLGLSVLSLVNCSSAYRQESTGQYIDSSAITMKVKSRLLADKSVKSLPITVKTYKNIVEVSGFVDTPQQRARILAITRNVPGVVEVRDALIIKHK